MSGNHGANNRLAGKRYKGSLLRGLRELQKCRNDNLVVLVFCLALNSQVDPKGFRLLVECEQLRPMLPLHCRQKLSGRLTLTARFQMHLYGILTAELWLCA